MFFGVGDVQVTGVSALPAYLGSPNEPEALLTVHQILS